VSAKQSFKDEQVMAKVPAARRRRAGGVKAATKGRPAVADADLAVGLVGDAEQPRLPSHGVVPAQVGSGTAAKQAKPSTDHQADANARDSTRPVMALRSAADAASSEGAAA
jgi:hypothetical protein